MSFIRITKTNTDTAYVRLHPSRSFSSSSSGVTGSVRVIAQSSPSFKEVTKTSPFIDSPVDASSLEDFRASAWLAATGSISASIAASGSLTGSRPSYASEIPSGRTLTFVDGSGNVYAAVTDDTKSKLQSTATTIGTDALATNTELMESIWTSLYEASAFGVESTVKSSPSGEKLRIVLPDFPTTDKMDIVMQDVGYQGNTEITGSLVGLPSPDLNVGNFGGGLGVSLFSLFDEYLSKVTEDSEAARQSKYVEVLRFTPTNTFTSDTMRKSAYRKVLLPNVLTSQPDTGYNFTNYQCYNFVSASAFPSASCLIYPEPLKEYAIMSGFTFSFNIKVDRDAGNDANGNAWPYPAGCVMFRSSSYAVSIVSGSKQTSKGNPLAWRVMLQLSGAVDTNPSEINLSSLPANTFLSSDNLLKKNHWHNVAISWGKNHNAGTGSFYIDGVHDTGADFTLGTIDICTGSETAQFNALMIGARYSGSNDGSTPTYAGFFNTNVSSEGVYSGGVSGGSEYEPRGGNVTSRLNAEVHDIRAYSNVLSPDQIATGSRSGLTEVPSGMVFYSPGYFVKGSPSRLSLLTPFQTETTGTQEPFNVKLNYGVNGRDINVQNFVRDFAQETHPRLWYLTSSAITKSTETFTANAFLLDVGENKLMHRARGMFILPSDNGKFVPGWTLLQSGSIDLRPSGSSPMSRFVTSLGDLNYAIVSLENMISTSSILEGLLQVNSDGSDNTSKNGLLQQVMGSSPEDASVDPGSGYTILQRTRDNSSNLVVFFDSSNLFYGNRIEPNSFTVSETALSGTSGLLSMTFKDNGIGGLYRADASSKHAEFSRVGDVLYEEGLAGLMHPCVPFFGKNSFSVEMKGDQNIHVYEVNVPALAGMLNSSSNPRFVAGAKDDYASSYEGTATGISSILFHDQNFNVIARTNLAQPILKTEFDKYLFRVKFDF